MADCLLLFLLFQDPATLAREDVKKGLELSQKGDGGVASGYFETALKLDPNDVEAAYYLAVNQYRLGQFSPAKANLERILKAKPEMKRATVLLGVVLERLNDDRGAIRLLESAADLVRQQPEWIAVLARCYYRTGLSKKGRETLGWLQPASPAAVFLGAETAAQSRDFDAAERRCDWMRSTSPDRGRWGYERAMVKYRGNRFAESQAPLEQRRAGGARDARVYNLVGWCYHRQNRLPEAVA